MKLLGLQLSAAGLSFMEARGRHTSDGLHVDDVVCETREDADKVDAWAAREGYPVRARVATPEERAEWKKLQDDA